MNSELTKKLYERHPAIFRQRTSPITDSLMAFGFECGDGWYAILDALCGELDGVAKNYGLRIEASQVKEKFGGLRFYYDAVPAEGWTRLTGLAWARAWLERWLYFAKTSVTNGWERLWRISEWDRYAVVWETCPSGIRVGRYANPKTLLPVHRQIWNHFKARWKEGLIQFYFPNPRLPYGSWQTLDGTYISTPADLECAYGQIMGAIDMAEAMSYRTCEKCGQPGTERSDGWIRTLCDNCEERRYPLEGA